MSELYLSSLCPDPNYTLTRNLACKRQLGLIDLKPLSQSSAAINLSANGVCVTSTHYPVIGHLR